MLRDLSQVKFLIILSSMFTLLNIASTSIASLTAFSNMNNNITNKITTGSSKTSHALIASKCLLNASSVKSLQYFEIRDRFSELLS